MAKFQMTELVNTSTFTSRLGTGTGSANFYTDAEKGKFVKLVGESRYALAASGDEIEGVIDSVNPASQDGYTIGAVRDSVGAAKFLKVTFDGAQADGSGVLAIGDYCVVGTVVAKDTALTVPAKVRKATSQSGAKATPFAWRVVSLGTAGTGATGTTGVIQRVGA